MNIVINNLNKAFDKKIIFSSFSYTFTENSIYVIEGDSGIGKTTLLRIIAGLDTDFDGEVLGGGIDNCSFMFQEYRLFPTANALENVLLSRPKENRDEYEAISLLKKLGFTEEEMYQTPDMLSGGMKQRISFVRAVYSDRPIILLDEPTKELDTTLADKMLEMIKELAKEKTIILVSHNPTEHILDNATLIKL